MAQVKQEPPTPGNVAMPKTTPATTIVKRGKGRGKKAPTVRDSYEILANINDPEIEEVEMNMEPEMEPPI